MLRWTFCVFPMAVCFFWLMVLALDSLRRSGGRDTRALAAYALVCTLLYACHAWHFLGVGEGFDGVEILYTFCTLASYVVYYLYIKALTDEKGLCWSDCVWLLPAVLASATGAVLLLLGRDTRIVPVLVKIITPVEIVLVAVFGLRRLRKFDRQVEDFYSDPENYSARPIRILMATFILLAVFAFFANAIGRDYFGVSLRLSIPSLLFGAMQFAILYVGSRQESTAEKMSHGDAGLSGDLAEKGDFADLGKRITALMEGQRLYRRQGLRITDVAASAGSNRTYVSQWFNQEVGRSFSEYINGWRVEDAKKLLLSGGDNPSMNEIAEEAGFSSESSFFRNFRAFTGQTPMAWLKEHRQRTEKAKIMASS